VEVTILKKEQLNKLASGREHNQFPQSWEWGEFQISAGNRVMRLGFKDGDRLFFALSLIKKVLPLGLNYFYAPRINLENLSLEKIKFIFDSIKSIAKKEKVIFLRFEPANGFSIADFRLPIIRTIDVQPSRTVILNLEKTADELLSAMHQKTRYNIRLAEKKGVIIREAGVDDFEKFWKLMEETKQRDGFRLHGKEYYRKMLNIQYPISNSQLSIRLFVAEYESKIIAGNIVVFFGDTVTYMHGASGGEYRNVMAPYLLQWHIIKLAKDSGYKYYDFYGVDEKKWPGVTRFKTGFGAEEINYPGTFDLVFGQGWYSIYRLVRRIRRGI